MGEPYQIMLPNNRLRSLARTWPEGATPPFNLMSVGSWSGIPGASTRGSVETTGVQCKPCMSAWGGSRKVPLHATVEHFRHPGGARCVTILGGIVVVIAACCAIKRAMTL